MTTLDRARNLRTFSVATIPVNPDKRPRVNAWGKYRDALPSEEELTTWFSNGAGIAIVGGLTQCLDIDCKNAPDGPGLWDRFIQRCEEWNLAGILQNTVIQRTVSGGFHIIWTCQAELRNVRLAATKDNNVLIETRGLGGYFLIEPSEGYKVIHGDFSCIPELSEDDRDQILAAARSLDEQVHVEKPIAPVPDSTPGDDYDRRGNLFSLLEQHGWSRETSDGSKWTRPGKSSGVSATFSDDHNRFYVWSTSTQFDAPAAYRPFAVFAVLECAGDFHEAARRLAAQGYGAQKQPGGVRTPAPRFQRDLEAEAGPVASPDDLLAKLDARAFNPDKPPAAPQPRFFIKLEGSKHLIGICTPGNLTAISATVKSGKSSWVGAMIAAAVTEDPDDVDCLSLVASPSDGAAIIHFDTEQSPYDHHNLVHTAVKRSSRQTTPPEVRSYCVTGWSNKDIRAVLSLEMARAAKECGSVHSVVLDGIGDMVANVNDPEECNAFVAELHALAIEFNCPIIGVIHVNPGSEKTRGHLGSQFERKAESNLRLEKQEDVTVIWSDKNRRASIPKTAGPCFKWDENAKMHTTAGTMSDALREQRAIGYLETARHILKTKKSNCLTYSEWVNAFMVEEGIKERRAKDRLRDLRDAGYMADNKLGQISISARQ